MMSGLKGVTVVPMKVYLSHGLAKLEIGVAKGKKLYDKPTGDSQTR